MTVYGIKNKSDILVNVLNSLQKDAGITAIYPGSIARAFAEAFTSEISDLYESLRFNINQNNLLTASGKNLDLIGDLYGIQRKTITDYSAEDRQSFNIEFFINKAHSSDVLIPSGTLVYNDVSNFVTKQYSFKLVGDVTIARGNLKAYGRVEPNFTDNAYVAPVNSLTKHSFFSPAGVILFCNNPKEVYSNVNSESDSNYRRRIVASIKSKAVGTVESVRFAALSVRGVRDVKIREGSYGVGSCDIIVVPENSSALSNLPQNIILATSQVKPVGVKFNVRIAEKVGIGLSYTIRIPMGVNETLAAGIRNQSVLFVKRYLNSLSVGETLSVGELERQIKTASDYIRGVVITAMTADGREIPLTDYTPDGVKKYLAAGTITVNSVIMGTSVY
jgi:uncharacterized phage protein gp47/JayE